MNIHSKALKSIFVMHSVKKKNAFNSLVRSSFSMFFSGDFLESKIGGAQLLRKNFECELAVEKGVGYRIDAMAAGTSKPLLKQFY